MKHTIVSHGDRTALGIEVTAIAVVCTEWYLDCMQFVPRES